MTYYRVYANDELYHHGIKGMKWGVRRYQNKDGTRTALGRRLEAMREYGSSVRSAKKARRSRDSKIQSDYDRTERNIEKGYKRGQLLSEADQKRELAADEKATKEWANSSKQYKKDKAAAKAKYKQAIKDIKNDPEYKKQTETAKKVAIGAAVVAGVALAAYGGYKLSKSESFNKAIANRYLKKADKSISDYNLATKNATEFARRSRGFRSGMQYSNNADTIMKMHRKANANAQASLSYLSDAEKYRKKASKYAGKANKYVNRAYAARYKGKSFSKAFDGGVYKTIRG